MTIIRVGTPQADLQLARALRSAPFRRRLKLYREAREMAKAQQMLHPKSRKARLLLLRFCRNMVALAELDP